MELLLGVIVFFATLVAMGLLFPTPPSRRSAHGGDAISVKLAGVIVRQARDYLSAHIQLAIFRDRGWLTPEQQAEIAHDFVEPWPADRAFPLPALEASVYRADAERSS